MSSSPSEKISHIYKSERGRLLGYIKKRISDKLDAEDLLHDVFYKLTVGFFDIRSIDNINSWLYRVTDNLITDLFRKKKHDTVNFSEKIIDDEDGPVTLQEILPALEFSFEDEEINRIVWETIDKTLADLPEEQRSVFVAHEFDELSFIEISEKTGIGVNTLISRKRYAVLALRDSLNDLYNLLKNN